jgi:hypothetical protein
MAFVAFFMDALALFDFVAATALVATSSTVARRAGSVIFRPAFNMICATTGPYFLRHALFIASSWIFFQKRTCAFEK